MQHTTQQDAWGSLDITYGANKTVNYAHKM